MEPSALPPAIEAHQLEVSLRRNFWQRPARLLGPVSLRIKAGETFGLLGANGAGKTTLLRTLVGLISPTFGQVELFGRPAHLPRSRRDLGMVAEQAVFPVALSALEIVSLHAHLGGLRPAVARREATAALELLGLCKPAVQNRRFGKMSKGMQQRVNLAQGMIHAPRLLVLDEPMSGLDPPGRILLRKLLVERQKAGCTILFSSHHLGDVELLCDRVGVLRGGALVYQGSPQGEAALQGEVLLAASAVSEGLAAAVARRHPQVQRRDTHPTAVFICPSLEVANQVLDQLRAGNSTILQVQRLQHALEAHFPDIAPAPEAPDP
jgi:ABC-2 type transport system ATP-binding protein